MALVITISAFAGYFALANIVHALTPGCPAIVFQPEFFALAALVALTSSTLAGLVPTMLQVGRSPILHSWKAERLQYHSDPEIGHIERHIR